MSFKVNLAVVGRFHAFNLALQLQKHDMLNKLITTYPKFLTKKFGINNDAVVSEPSLELFNRVRQKFLFNIPLINNSIYWGNFTNKRHAIKSSKYLKDCDIFIGFSGSSLEAIIEAKKLGKITILERGSSHYNYQMKILQEEYLKFDIPFLPDYLHWQRELLEYELSDYISIPSSFVKKTFLKEGIIKEKILLNPYGVNLSEFAQIPKNDDIFRIIYAGNLSIRKGSYYLLEAFNELNLPKSELWHIGTINNEILPLLNKCNNNYKIKFLGHKPQKELYRYYSQGSIFVIPSIEEGLAMVIAQALSCGLPCVVSENTGAGDIIENDFNGYVIPIRNIELLKEKILFLYEDKCKLENMSKNAVNSISKMKLTWDDYGNRYIENLERMMQNKKA